MPDVIRSQQQAHKARTKHQFVPGIGYLEHSGAPDIRPHPAGGKNCDPAPGTADGSLHTMRPPNGHPPMMMMWIAAEKAWASRQPERGNRLAWSTAHLSKAGWEYVGPKS